MKNYLTLFIICLITEGFAQNVGSSAAVEVNSIYLPFNNKGVIADVNVPPNGSQGQFDGNAFLFSSGFWLSGYAGNSLWANGVASASLVEDYQAGIVGMDPNDPLASIYKINVNDVPFGQSWQDWIDAVALGADFYDGDGDGIYNPVDLNGNNQWDPTEDMPDLLLDETYWCVYNDGLLASQRRWGSVPMGIEIRQTIFAQSSATATSNAIFVRYRIKNTGSVSDTLNDVYFTSWADADIGTSSDDVYGCDTIRQSFYFYNDTTDAIYGDQVPSFMIDILTKPKVYVAGETYIDLNGNNIYDDGIDTPLDTAYIYSGPLGVQIYPGAKNLDVSGFATYVNSDPTLRDPNNVNEVRDYVLSLDLSGQVIDPCTWPYAQVLGGVQCNEVNPYFWCSGDPVTDVGWIFTNNRDVRSLGSVGPFNLIKNQEIEILVGYEIDNSTTPLGGITAVRNVSDYVQDFYDNNFGYPAVLSIDNHNSNPRQYSLLQNYPNPFNPSTKIKYILPESGLVKLIVYDLLGNEVAVLKNEEQSAGKYDITFNASKLSSGIYFYTLSVNEFIQTKKMILIK